jgi:type I restriction-modification system DNA methylase subunit
MIRRFLALFRRGTSASKVLNCLVVPLSVMDRESAKKEITGLVDKYNRVVEEGRVARYTEEETRKDFIEPLFSALGWNTRDSTEVSAEEKISKGYVDYGFRINGIPKFFLEAKALRKNLDDPDFVRQAVNYSWLKGCTWAVLTNFETVRIFNAEWKTANHFQSHFRTIHCAEFLSKFDDLWLLSRESFKQGQIDKEAERLAKRTTRTSVDRQLLADFTRFRELLSKNITKLNQGKKLTQEELDESIQRMLDRLIFIRNCEDRELEPKTLISSYREWESKGRGQLIKSLREEVFAYFDEHYNSKIFAHHLCDDLEIDNDILHEIIEGLYNTKDKLGIYDFSLIDADVLGNIYEQYLSHILKKTAKRATLTENHIHRKEQGIYYTPTYIVDYIVRNTLGELLKDTNVDAEKIRVLDPACGSGSFLIKAFDVLHDHYKNNDKDYAQTQLDLKTGVPFKRKVKILQDNIFGVDLDKQAVEIAQLNLLLKIAEKGRRLPLLEQNIKCGNSIIDDTEIAGNKAFVWEEEFKDTLREGGFDIIIGNPPYGAELSETERSFISNKFKFSTSYKNTALIFVEKSLGLIKDTGNFGMIVPKSLAFSQLWKSGRELIKEHLVKVVDVSKAFEDVLLEQMIIILNKSVKSNYYILQDITSGESISVDKKFIDSTDSILLHGKQKDFEIFKKMNQYAHRFSDVTKTSRGLPFQKYLTKEKTRYPVIKGKTISRYNCRLNDEYLPPEIVEKNKAKMSFLQQPKIVSQRIVAHVTKPKDHIIIMSALDEKNLMTVDTVENTISTDENYPLKFLLGLLNSKLISWYAYRYIFSKAIRTMDFDDYYLGKIPLPSVMAESSALINFVDKMLSLNKRFNEIGDKLTDERTRIEGEIRKTDAEIDELVYRIYGITEDEKKTIKDSRK